MKQQRTKKRWEAWIQKRWSNCSDCSDSRLAPRKLFHFFHAAQLLRKDSQLLRLAATHPGALHDGLSRLVTLTSHEATLRSALDGELDREAPERIIHVAASIGNMPVLRLALQAGQHINSFSAKGETPAMLAASAGHAETLRYLLRNQADVARKSRAGFTALEYAARNGHPEVVRLLRDPFSQLAWGKKEHSCHNFCALPWFCHFDQTTCTMLCQHVDSRCTPWHSTFVHHVCSRGFGDAAVIGATRPRRELRQMAFRKKKNKLQLELVETWDPDRNCEVSHQDISL